MDVIKDWVEHQKKSIPAKQISGSLSANEITNLILFDDGDTKEELKNEAKILELPSRCISVDITTVVNKDKNDPFDIYIGRGSPWGNPYAVGFGNGPDEDQNDREEAIRKYQYDFDRGLLGDEHFKTNLLALKGKRLGCHCKPLACHGDVLADYLNSHDDEK